MKKKPAVCLMSGGLDSCVTAAMAARRYELALLHLNYGQLTEARELRAFFDLADYFKVPKHRRLVVELDHLKKIGGSTLTDPGFRGPDNDLARVGVPPTYVPFRNANILALGVSWAEVIGAGKIFIGAMEEDSSGYPDCREEFFRAFNRVIETGTRPETRIVIETPIIHLSKAEVVKWGMENGAPLYLTWSCYTSNGPKACGVCESCALRLRGFRQAGYQDPVPYRTS
ncbi:MAG: 7-cyano-7-deazaguanine synthase QueC [Candidatus Euphemobacter frigidus]|nr:7-cyano-7-deazaguanine synthase QueC [Candidatus Euphemobacter frigidus]MDP8275845.1 7-cyano-7-deazaguanine synthase QueC [Candidatus Euphemobacter frigidus]